MALSDYKITDNQISTKGIISAPDRLTGSAAENKALFDRLIREAVKSDLNGLIDALSSAAGAALIGAEDSDGAASTIQEELDKRVETDVYNPEQKTEGMTQTVGVDGNGKLWTMPGGGTPHWSNVQGKPFATIGEGLTVDDNVLKATGQVPAATAADNGKFLSVVNGEYALVNVPQAAGSSF